MSVALSVRNLRKSFGPFDAVRGITFEVPQGKIIGLLGPNGAGKTTTMHLLLGVTSADAGSIHYFGQDFGTHRQDCLARINFASTYNELQGRLTSYENLLVFAELYSVSDPKRRIQELADQFDLGALIHQRYWDLSAGQKTRVHFVKALLNNPAMLLMDEPTASLDPDVTDTVLTFIEQLRRDHQISILYTSHDMAEVARICDEVIFLDHGEIVAHDTPLGLTKKITTATLTLTFDGPQRAVKAYLARRKIDGAFPIKNVVKITTEEKELPKIIFGLSEANVWLTNIDIAKPTLEHVFLQIARGRKDVR